jgi:hypothetical protein
MLTIAAAAIIAVAHFCLSWVSFMKSELIRPNDATESWKMVTRILAFPLIYLSNVGSTVDLFPVLMIANSLLWGLTIVMVVKWCIHRVRQ